MLPPFHFQEWIDRHKKDLAPPVGNKRVFHESTFIVMVVGGPNERTDFHINQTDEFFYQLQGQMNLRIMEKNRFKDIPINSGEIFMLPKGIPHSPQRSKDSIGLVVEKTRTPGDIDTLQWYCKQCCHLLYSESFYLEDIETQFKAVFDRYYNSLHTTCSQCQTVTNKVW